MEHVMHGLFLRLLYGIYLLYCFYDIICFHYFYRISKTKIQKEEFIREKFFVMSNLYDNIPYLSMLVYIPVFDIIFLCLYVL